MATRVDIDDINKLRPELTNISLAELERRRAELDMAEKIIREREEAKAREEYERKLAEARVEHDELVADLLESATDAIHKLNRYGLLKDEVLAVATDSRGVFVPANLFRRKLPADWTPPGFGDVPPMTKRGASKRQARQDVLSSKGQKPIEAITELFEKKPGPYTRDEILNEMGKDAGFAPFVKSNPKSFTGAISFMVRKGIITRDGDNYKKA